MFDEVTLAWKGETITLQPSMELVHEIERSLRQSSGESSIAVLTRQSGLENGELASAYGAALRFAGCKVTDEEILSDLDEELVASFTDKAVREGVQAKRTLQLFSIMATVRPKLARFMSGASEKK